MTRKLMFHWISECKGVANKDGIDYHWSVSLGLLWRENQNTVITVNVWMDQLESAQMEPCPLCRALLLTRAHRVRANRALVDSSALQMEQSATQDTDQLSCHPDTCQHHSSQGTGSALKRGTLCNMASSEVTYRRDASCLETVKDSRILICQCSRQPLGDPLDAGIESHSGGVIIPIRPSGQTRK